MKKENALIIALSAMERRESMLIEQLKQHQIDNAQNMVVKLNEQILTMREAIKTTREMLRELSTGEQTQLPISEGRSLYMLRD